MSSISVGPTYPVFLAAVYSVFGHDVAAVRIVQALLSAVLVLVIWQVAQTFPTFASLLSPSGRSWSGHGRYRSRDATRRSLFCQ